MNLNHLRRLLKKMHISRKEFIYKVVMNVKFVVG